MLKTGLTRRETLAVKMRARRGSQRGVVMLEALVSIMIVMLGIIGIAGLLAKSTNMAGQAQYRTEAGMFAEQIVQTISLGVDRTSDDTLTNSLKTFEHQASGAKPCSFSGSTVNQSSPVGQLLMGARGDLQKVAGLPGAQDDGQQVKVETTDKINRVTVTLCWQGPNDGDKRNNQIQAFVH